MLYCQLGDVTVISSVECRKRTSYVLKLGGCSRVHKHPLQTGHSEHEGSKEHSLQTGQSEHERSKEHSSQTGDSGHG